MLIRPTPLPDELDQGYLGRVMRLNGATNRKAIDRLMRSWVGVPGSNWRDVPCVVLLSKVSGMTVTDFVIRHTLLPLRRGITSYRPEVRHGCESGRNMLWSTAMRLARDGAYFCEQCVSEDIRHHGYSYWRRFHQVPGGFWCSRHSESLHYVESESAFLCLPSTFLETADYISPAWVQESMKKPAVVRYLEICDWLIQRECPLDVKSVSQILRERAQSQGFQINKGVAKYPFLSDLAIDQCGRPWLATVLPTLANKEIGKISQQLDGVFFQNTSASSVMGYALAAALLFESADEACLALCEHREQKPVVSPRCKAGLSTEDIVAAYIQARGDYGKAAMGFDCGYQTISKRYGTLGLPNFATRGGKDLLGAAHAFFVEKRSFTESALADGINQESMEDLIREAGANLVPVLLAIFRPGGRGSGKRRPRRLAPSDLNDFADGVFPVKYSPKARPDQK